MAKKRTRKSRKARRSPQPIQPQVSEQSVDTMPEAKRTLASRVETRRMSDFVQEYAYVYFDLRKMFTVAAVMFVLLILTNVILTRFVVL